MPSPRLKSPLSSVALTTLWLLSIFYTPPALAEEACPAIRLDQTPALRAIPLWDQQDSFLCYAFSASVLIDAQRLKSPGQSGFTSPLSLAADTVAYSHSRNKRSSFWAGWINQSIEVARENGSCKAGWLGDGLGKRGLKESLPALRAFQVEAQKEDPLVVAEKVRKFLLESGAKDLPEASSISASLRKSQDEFISDLIGSFCQERLPVALPEFHSEDRSYAKDKPAFADRISGVLAAGSPLAAEFCAEVVTNPKFSPGYNSICSRHYVVVVGQRPENNRCELLIRDSQCSQYPSKAGNTGCENSHYWINRQAFLSNTQAVHWLKPIP